MQLLTAVCHFLHLDPNHKVTENIVGCIGGKAIGRYGWNCTVVDNSTGKLVPPQFPSIKSRNLAVSTEADSGGNWSYAILVDSLVFGGFKPYPAPHSQIDGAAANIPFSADYGSAALATVTVKARNLNYGKAGAGLVWKNAGLPPHSPIDAPADAPLETLTLGASRDPAISKLYLSLLTAFPLVPFGATNIRISAFPQLAK
jgi:hypothetical protein